MDGVYGITYCGQKIGKAVIKTCGLYFDIACTCDLPDDRVHRINIQTTEQKIQLGVYIPAGKNAGLKRRIPIKQIRSTANVQFCLDGDTVIDMIEDMPLPVLKRLDSLCYRDGKLYYSNM